MVIKVLLLFGICQVVLSPEHMSKSHQMVIDGHRKVHHRIDSVFIAKTRMLCIFQSHCNPVTDCRVFMIDVGFDSQYCLAGFHCVEFFPQLQVLFNGVVPAWARLAVILELLECCTVTGTHVGRTLFNQLASNVIINLKPVGLIDYFISLDPQPFQVFGNHFISRFVDPFRVGILNP